MIRDMLMNMRNRPVRIITNKTQNADKLYKIILFYDGEGTNKGFVEVEDQNNIVQFISLDSIDRIIVVSKREARM